MLKDRIRKILQRRPYWGPQTVAKAAGTDVRVIRVVASREGIKMMDRYEVEAYVDKLVDTIEKLGGTADGPQE
jgi:hypothetical protein